MMFASCNAQTVSRDQRIELFKGTRLCKFNAMGRCKRGRDCKFAHSEANVKEQPDFSKTRLCQEFVETGFCRHREHCKFAHGKDELRSRNETMPAGPKGCKGSNDMTSLGIQELLQAVLQVRASASYEAAALSLLLRGAFGSSPGEKLQQTADAEHCFLKESLAFSRQSTCFDDDCSLPAFSRNSTDEALSFQSGVEEASMDEASDSAQDMSESPPASSSSRDKYSDVEMVMVKNTFIHIETQEEAAPRHLRRVCSAPALLKHE
eukprot:TRINITY_DN56793_c0_g1_i1.p1 TRINITY_DN56793_c0_g1~~TRINITY_DN56793_c0_g1_i1.p1  ORF type:complete len:264 (-),score=65.71 TRINITY_DN56793_c0_g1_i1:449-1240(-)